MKVKMTCFAVAAVVVVVLVVFVAGNRSASAESPLATATGTWSGTSWNCPSAPPGCDATSATPITLTLTQHGHSVTGAAARTGSAPIATVTGAVVLMTPAYSLIDVHIETNFTPDCLPNSPTIWAGLLKLDASKQTLAGTISTGFEPENCHHEIDGFYLTRQDP